MHLLLVISLAIFISGLITQNAVSAFSTGVGENHGDNNPSKKNCKKSDTLEEISKKIDAQKCAYNDIKDYKKYNFYKLEDKETKVCIENRADLGGSLADYEVLHCFEDSDYGY